MSVTRTDVQGWIDSYERAWRSPGTAALADLFTDDATYLQGPYREAVVGLDAIGRMWEAERAGPDEVFRMTSEVIAVDGDTAVVRVEVDYGDPVEQQYRDLWLIWFADDAGARSARAAPSRCRRFQEWPFWPDRRTSDG